MLNRRSFCLALSLSAAPQVLAAACDPLAPQLSLCDAAGWTLDRVEGNVSHLTHANGVTATVQLQTGLDAEALAGTRRMVAHMPISARAQVLATTAFEIGEQYGTTVAYLPRHADPATVVVLSDLIDRDYALIVSTQQTGVTTLTEAHMKAHDWLLAALQLDPSE